MPDFMPRRFAGHVVKPTSAQCLSDNKCSTQKLQLHSLKQTSPWPQIQDFKVCFAEQIPAPARENHSRRKLRWSDCNSHARSATSLAARQRFDQPLHPNLTARANAGAPGVKRHCLRRPARPHGAFQFPIAAFRFSRPRPASTTTAGLRLAPDP